MNDPNFDLIIAGGGMVGASLACALSSTNLRIALIEAVPGKADSQPSYDDRGLALSLSSHRILQQLQLWPQLTANATPILHIHVSDRGFLGCVRLHAADLQVDALGHVVIARELGLALSQRLSQTGNVVVMCPAEVSSIDVAYNTVTVTTTGPAGTGTLHGRLLVVADGTNSKLRQQLNITTQVKDYSQTALVTNVTLGRPHGHTAYERFTENGPIAVLPLSGQRAVIVHTVATDQAESCSQMPDGAYLDLLWQGFGRRLGRFSRMGSIRMYPLQMQLAEQQTLSRIVLLGNAAHTIHPNGAQGFNLCLRDVAALAEKLSQVALAAGDIGANEVLAGYLASRQQDQQRVTRYSDRLTELFSNRHLPKVLLRNTGMLLIDIMPFLKRELIRQALGISGRQPAMVSGAWN